MRDAPRFSLSPIEHFLISPAESALAGIVALKAFPACYAGCRNAGFRTPAMAGQS